MIITVDQWKTLVDILRAEYAKSKFPKVDSGYLDFIRYFEKENDVKILGERHACDWWSTDAIEFKDEKDALFFKISYGA